MLECQDWSSAMFLFTNCSHCILWQAVCGDDFIVTGGNFAEHIFVKCPKKEDFFWQRKKHLIGAEDSQYWTLVPTIQCHYPSYDRVKGEPTRVKIGNLFLYFEPKILPTQPKVSLWAAIFMQFIVTCYWNYQISCLVIYYGFQFLPRKVKAIVWTL